MLWKSVKLLALFGPPTFIAFAQAFRILLLPAKIQTPGEERSGSPAPILQYPAIFVKLLAMFIGELTFDELMKDVKIGRASCRERV